jgi:hypothetical protein
LQNPSSELNPITIEGHHHRVGSIAIDGLSPLIWGYCLIGRAACFSMLGTATNFWSSANCGRSEPESMSWAKILAVRNTLAHGALEVHTPETSLATLSRCGEVINRICEAR